MALKAQNIPLAKRKVINKTAFYCLVPMLERYLKVHKNKTFSRVSHLNSLPLFHSSGCSVTFAFILHCILLQFGVSRFSVLFFSLEHTVKV